jgi:hypothetical protein
MRRPMLLVSSALAVVLSTHPSRANSCSQEIDRAWTQVTAKSPGKKQRREVRAPGHDSLSSPPADAELS